ncbi:MAG: hypothetical protein ACOYMB_04370 [Patescibacteria group bacterium]
MQKGKNFNECPLTYQEFIELDINKRAVYNNFFLSLYNHHRDVGKNYERLRSVNADLAKELSEEYNQYYLGEEPREQDYLPGHCFSISALRKGYQAYLILRKSFADDEALQKEMQNYRSHQSCNISDDWAAFFA